MSLSGLATLLADAEPDQCGSHRAASRFGNANAVEIETGLLLFVRRLRCATVLETGTYFGYSSAFIGLALAEMQPVGHLITIDRHPHDYKAEALWANLGLTHLITRVIDDSLNYEPVYPVDFLWLDADHSASTIVSEFEHYLPHLSRASAVVAIHDTDIHPGMDDGVNRIVAAARETYPHVAHFKMRNMRGLDIIQLASKFPVPR